MEMKWKLPCKIAAVALSLLMLLSTLGAYGALADTTQEDTAELEHVSFTILSLDDYPDLMTWPLVAEATEKFNFDFKVQQVAWDSWDESIRTLVATDSLPEVVAWYNLIYSEYLDWANQGVFKAIPDLEPYPNLKKITEQYSIFDNIRVDGELYAFPKIIENNPWNDYANYTILYRKDWAEAVGRNLDDVQTMSWDEFSDFLREVQAQDPGGLGESLIPFDPVHGGNSWVDLIRWLYNPHVAGFHKVDGSYVWGADEPSSLDGIMALHQLYNEGLLYHDSYMDSMGAGTERFTAGRSAVYMAPMAPVVLQEQLQNMSELGLTFEDFGIITLTDPEGKYKTLQKIEWWGAFAFSADCRDEVAERWMMLGDWLLELEQLEKAAYGVYGEDWTRDGDVITINWTPDQLSNEKGYINGHKNCFLKYFVLEGQDTFLPGNPSVNQYSLNLYKDMMLTFDSNPSHTPTDYDLAFYVSESYNANTATLSVNTRDAIIQAVVSNDPAEVWNTFLEANRANVDAALEELNGVFGK